MPIRNYSVDEVHELVEMIKQQVLASLKDCDTPWVDEEIDDAFERWQRQTR